MILLIDNYDSFTYNLYQYIGMLNPNVVVYRNDKITVNEIEEINPSHIIISPGPKYPKDAGISMEVIKKLYKKYPILGVCLGHQAICEAFGGKTIHAPKIMHGKTDRIKIVDKHSKLFSGIIGYEIDVARYHSLVTDENTLPECLRITAKSIDGSIMAVQHNEYPVYGVQFHPESIMATEGMTILKNFLKERVSDDCTVY